MADNVLFICGSLNQTTQMYKIAEHMEEYNCHFTPYYADGIEGFAARMGWLDFTVLGGRHHRDTLEYLAGNHLSIDHGGHMRDYDLVVTCSDLIVQKNIYNRRMVLVQEGITEAETWSYALAKTFPFLPRYIANTAMTGLSDAYDVFCVASEGYRELFIRKGVRPDKVAVTGIPNFDHLQSYTQNDFPYHDFVLVATTPYRETFRHEDRPAFLRMCVNIAAGRPMIFKLHPTENVKRARREINRYAPGSMVLECGNINPMIANAAVVITQQSSCTFVALELGKEVHTYLQKEELHKLMPIQNKAKAAERIASICRRIIVTPMPLLRRIRRGIRTRPRWEQADAI